MKSRRRRRRHTPTPRSHSQIAITKRKKKVKITKTTSGHLKIADFHWFYAHQGISCVCLIFEILTARGREAHFEKIRKSEKQNVNGSAEKQYVLLEFLTALEFCSMFRFRRDTSRVSTKSGLGEAKRGTAWIWPKSGRPV